MFRRMFIAASVLSLLVCIVAVWLWVNSYRREVRVMSLLQFADHSGMTQIDIELVSLRGGVLVRVRRDRADTEDGANRLRMNRMCRPLWMARTRSVTEVDAYRDPIEPRESYIYSPTKRARLGFQVGRSHWSYPPGITWAEFRVLLPFWFIAGMAAVLPFARAASAFRATSRHRSGHCRTCGYDLRASKERCPECGAPISSKAGTRE